MRLKNTTAWITGGGQRLGRVLALELARRGCNLAIHYRSSGAEAHEVAHEAEQMGRRALVARADLADVEEIYSMGRRIENEFGGLDILINCAANFERTTLEDVNEDAWDRAVDVNLKGSAFCALEAARLMRMKRESGATLASPLAFFSKASSEHAPEHERVSAQIIDLDGSRSQLGPDSQAEGAEEIEGAGLAAPILWGKIINFADWSALRPYRNYLPYMVSKGGVVTLTQALAQELAPQITVNAVAPGTVLPPENTSPGELEKITANIPLRRLGTPSDIVATVLYLLEGSDYVTGQVLCVDGGRYVAQPGRS